MQLCPKKSSFTGSDHGDAPLRLLVKGFRCVCLWKVSQSGARDPQLLLCTQRGMIAKKEEYDVVLGGRLNLAMALCYEAKITISKTRDARLCFSLVPPPL